MPVMPCGSNNALHFCVAPGEESSREGDEVKVIKEVNAVTIILCMWSLCKLKKINDLPASVGAPPRHITNELLKAVPVLICLRCLYVAKLCMWLQ